MSAISATFSFRTFDMYRRFVEILKIEPELLKEFQDGAPKEESCYLMVKRIFCYNQPKQKMEALINYLVKNSKTMAKHTINVPPNWNNAVEYTNQCISLIKKYLRNNRINLKTISSINLNELATKIASTVYETPTENQIEAIAEYLEHDIRNPKKNIINVRKSINVEVSSRSSLFHQNNTICNGIVKKTKGKLKTKINTSFNKTLILNNEREMKVTDLETSAIKNKNIYNHFLMPNDASNSHEKVLKMKDKLELEKILQTDEVTISPADLLTAQHKSLNENTAHTENKNESVTAVNGYQYKFNDYIKSLKNNSSKNQQENEINIIEDNEKLKSTIETENQEKENTQKFYNSLGLKRKNSVQNHNDTNEENNTKIATVSELDNSLDFTMAKIEALNASNNSTTYDSLNDTQVSLDKKIGNKVKRRKINPLSPKALKETMAKVNSENPQKQMTLRSSTPKIYYDTKRQSSNSTTLKKKSANNNITFHKKETLTLCSEGKKESDSHTQDPLQLSIPKNIITHSSNLEIIPHEQLERLKEKSITENKVKYKRIPRMSHLEILQMMEKVVAFCELNNEISLEEFLVLRQIRDKMHRRSLTKKKKIV